MRNDNLGRIKMLLQTSDGSILMEELKAQFSPMQFDPEHATRLAYEAGKRDAYEYLVMLENGSLINE